MKNNAIDWLGWIGLLFIVLKCISCFESPKIIDSKQSYYPPQPIITPTPKPTPTIEEKENEEWDKKVRLQNEYLSYKFAEDWKKEHPFEVAVAAEEQKKLEQKEKERKENEENEEILKRNIAKIEDSERQYSESFCGTLNSIVHETIGPMTPYDQSNIIVGLLFLILLVLFVRVIIPIIKGKN